MKVKCAKIISPTTKKDLGEHSPWLKRGKEYIVLALNWSSKFGMQIFIQTEQYNEPRFIFLDGFEIISQKIPVSWSTKTQEFGNQYIMTMQPQSWLSFNNFFDELDDENPEAVALFNKEAELIYKEEAESI